MTTHPGMDALKRLFHALDDKTGDPIAAEIRRFHKAYRDAHDAGNWNALVVAHLALGAALAKYRPPVKPYDPSEHTPRFWAERADRLERERQRQPMRGQ
jgi:hypothetical protein